jgi:4-diphosphocytidyl-2-C-methyl-D-erythritol kinase
VVVFPNCKINLGLHIVRKRPDGYHDLETVFYPFLLKDALEVVRSEKFNFQLSGLPVAGTIENNLCVKAYNLLKSDFSELPPVSIHLHKAIPMGAGVGGGSADGAFMLTLLNNKFRLNLSEEQLISYALKLGSDCPFFIINKPCFASGRGENLTPVPLDLSSYKIVLINPGIHVSTKEAFSKLTPSIPNKSILDVIKQPIINCKEELKNDFEETVFELFPAIQMVKKRLYEKGAIYAAMTGSGSSVFGIFDQDATFDFSWPTGYQFYVAGNMEK